MKNRCNREPAAEPPQKLIIDRFEGDFAVCEAFESNAAGELANVPKDHIATGTLINVPRDHIDACAREGSVIVYDITRRKYALDSEATAVRAARIRELANDLWK